MRLTPLHLILLIGVVVILTSTSKPKPEAPAPNPEPSGSSIDFGSVPLPGDPAGSPQGAPAPAPEAAPAEEPKPESDPVPAVKPDPEPKPDELAFAPPAPPEEIRIERAAAPPAEAPREDSFVQSVFEVVCPNGDAGCAVAIGPQTLATAHHVIERSGKQCGVIVNGQLFPATITRIPGGDNLLRDAALLTVSGVTLPHLQVREPRYLETARVYGLKTREVTTGIVSDGRSVSHYPPHRRAASGDSGGAVVGEDGQLIGIISGGDGSHPHVTKFASSTLFHNSNARGAIAPQDLAFPEPPQRNTRSPTCGAPMTPSTPSAPAMVPAAQCVNGFYRPRGRVLRIFR